MKFLKYLYCKYYKFQVRVGNSDIAPISAMLFIVVIVEIYYWGLLSFVSLIFSKNEKVYFDEFIQTFSILFPLIIVIILYFLLLFKGKYKIILKNFEEEEGYKGNLLAILFPIIGFLTTLGWILKMLQNQGKL